MIWIATLCLLAVAAWLFFNALNERRWVQAHSHDETVASDEGLLPNFTALTRSGTAAVSGLVSMDQENTRVANAISKVQEKSTDYGDKLKAAGSKLSQSASESDKFAEGKAALGRAARKSGELGQRAVHKATSKAQEFNESRGPAEAGSVFAKVVGKVSGGLEKLEQKVDDKLARNRAMDEASSSDDLVSRASDKVSPKINDIDEKIVDAGSTASSTVDKSNS